MNNPYIKERITNLSESKIKDLDKILTHLKLAKTIRRYNSNVFEELGIKDEPLIEFYVELLDRTKIAKKGLYKNKVQLDIIQYGEEFDSFEKEQARQIVFYGKDAIKKAEKERLEEERASIPSKGLKVSKQQLGLAGLVAIFTITNFIYTWSTDGKYADRIDKLNRKIRGLQIKDSMLEVRQKQLHLQILKTKK